jgi:hypothetical protein
MAKKGGEWWMVAITIEMAKIKTLKTNPHFFEKEFGVS